MTFVTCLNGNWALFLYLHVVFERICVFLHCISAWDVCPNSGHRDHTLEIKSELLKNEITSEINKFFLETLETNLLQKRHNLTPGGVLNMKILGNERRKRIFL